MLFLTLNDFTAIENKASVKIVSKLELCVTYLVTFSQCIFLSFPGCDLGNKLGVVIHVLNDREAEAGNLLVGGSVLRLFQGNSEDKQINKRLRFFELS